MHQKLTGQTFAGFLEAKLLAGEALAVLTGLFATATAAGALRADPAWAGSVLVLGGSTADWFAAGLGGPEKFSPSSMSKGKSGTGGMGSFSARRASGARSQSRNVAAEASTTRMVAVPAVRKNVNSPFVCAVAAELPGMAATVAMACSGDL